MGNFTTTLCIPTAFLPPDYVRVLNAKHADCDPLGPTDTAPDVEVEVTFKEGWYDPGRAYGPPERCYPPEGEDPDITSVTLQDEGFKGVELVKALSESLLEAIQVQAWEHQESTAQDDYQDPYDLVDD